MSKFVLRWAVTAGAVAVAAWVVPGIWVSEPHRVWAIIAVALVLGLVNAFIRPVIYAFSCGCLVATLGLFTIVINGLLLWLTSWVTVRWIGLGFHVSGFWSALTGAIIISVVSVFGSLFVGGRGRWN